MKRRFDQVLVFCPDATTGGPEALHQLVDSINRQGGQAKLVYTGPQSEFSIKDSVISCSLHPDSIAYKTYQRYSPEVLSTTKVTENSLLIFPEISVDLAWAVRCGLPCSVACWWLALHDLANTHDELWCRDFMNGVIQFNQSYYAFEHLHSRRAPAIVPLFDYTDRNFVRYGLIELEGTKRTAKRPRSIAYFPRKGRELANEFFKQVELKGLEIEPLAIENMTKDEVMTALGSSVIYIDFGHHPGKDRVPREAAAVGNVVLIHRVGAGRPFQDHSIDEDYKFDKDDIKSGKLIETVEAILNNPSRHLLNQRFYRQKIFLEPAEFDLQVRQFFFCSL